MKVSDLTFYPLHIDAMNVSDSIHNLMKSQDHNIIAFMPVQFEHVNEGNYTEHNNIARLSKR